MCLSFSGTWFIHTHAPAQSMQQQDTLQPRLSSTHAMPNVRVAPGSGGNAHQHFKVMPKGWLPRTAQNADPDRGLGDHCQQPPGPDSFLMRTVAVLLDATALS